MKTPISSGAQRLFPMPSPPKASPYLPGNGILPRGLFQVVDDARRAPKSRAGLTPPSCLCHSYRLFGRTNLQPGGEAMDGRTRELSLIVPACNEAAGIREAIAEADAALALLADTYEILV